VAERAEIKVRPEHKATRATLAYKELREQPVQQAHKVLPDRRVILGRKVSMVRLEPLVHKA
jgi:hypothetical protein